jgi:transcriptional regulator with XRE-family HTH domain
MPKTSLKDWQQQDARRLSALFEARRQQYGFTQKSFAEDYDLKSQGNVSQYLTGYIPLAIESAVKFSNGLVCLVEDFSPTLGAHMKQLGLFQRPVSIAPKGESLTPSEAKLIACYRIASADLKRALSAIADAHLAVKQAPKADINSADFFASLKPTTEVITINSLDIPPSADLSTNHTAFDGESDKRVRRVKENVEGSKRGESKHQKTAKRSGSKLRK